MFSPFAIAFTLLAQSPQSRIATTSEGLVGKAAPPVSLELLSGKRFDLAEQRGKVVFLAFWASWCEPCRREIPLLLHAEANHQDLIVIGINAEPRADAVAFLKEEKFQNFATALDPGETVAKAYGVDLVPRLFVIDQKGTITRMIRGIPSEIAIKRALEPLLAH